MVEYMKSKGNYVDGQWIKASGSKMSSYSPINEKLLWEGNSSDNKDIELATEAAKNAFSLWSNLELDERIAYLNKYVEMLKENKDALSKYIAYEVGKTFGESISEVNAMINKLAVSIEGFNFRNKTLIREQQNNLINVTRFRPHGVVAIIGPYNFPGHMPNSHIIPALIAGNTVVLKPSEKVPLCSEKIMELWDKANLPNGVINMIQGDGAIAENLVTSDDINAVFFTGSKKIGQKIEELCLHKKLCALEMGGNNPLIVWDTVNIDSVVLSTIQSAFGMSGQRCSSARRLIIPNNDFGDGFLNRLAQVTKSIKVGNIEDEEEPYIGSMKSSELVDNAISKQNQFVQNGAKIIVKAKRIPELGKAYITPSIIDITDMKGKNDEEIIAPFLQVIKVDNFDKAIEVANDTSYGLAAGIFTENKDLYEKFEKSIKAGVINWNQQLTGASGYSPFGGVKNSGNYRPSGFLATDYCVYATASLEREKANEVIDLPNGIRLDCK